MQRPEEDGKPSRPAGRRRWTSFIADDSAGDKPVRGLHEAANPKHRLRVEHDAHTLLVHLSDEDGAGWTTIAVDRRIRSSLSHEGEHLALPGAEGGAEGAGAAAGPE